MTFWVKVMGIPTHFWLEEIFKKIGNSIGVERGVEETAAKVRVELNADEPLVFVKRARLPSGEVVKVDLKYEKLYRWCLHCGHISHEERTCPSLSEAQRIEKQKERELVRTRDLPEQESSLQPPPARPPSHRIEYPRTSTRQDPPNRDRDVPTKDRPVRDGSEKEVVRPRSGRDDYYVPYRERESAWNRTNVTRDSYRPLTRNSNLGVIHYQGESSRQAEKSYRKRSFGDSFDINEVLKKDKSRLTLRIGERRSDPSQNIGTEPAAANLTSSDSQRTIIDPKAVPVKAKQRVSSPEFRRSRPFRLNLARKSQDIGKGKGKTLDSDDTSRTLSSARKKLIFAPQADIFPANAETLPKIPATQVPCKAPIPVIRDRNTSPESSMLLLLGWFAASISSGLVAIEKVLNSGSAKPSLLR